MAVNDIIRTRASRHASARRATVLHVLPDLRIGGGQTIVLNHVKHADRTRFDVLVASLSRDEDLADAFADAGAGPIWLDHVPGQPFGTLSRLVRLVRREGVDLLHVHSEVDRKCGHVVGLATARPVVGHLHAQGVHVGVTVPAGSGLGQRIRTRVLGHAKDVAERWAVDRYIAESSAVHDIYRSVVGQPIDILNQAVPTERFDEVDGAAVARVRRELALVHGGPVLVCVSRLVPGKGHIALLDAMVDVVRWWPTVTLLLVGDGELRQQVEMAIDDRRLTDNVRVVGNRHDVPAVLAASDVFVFASESEGFGLVALEAMAARKPVVAFRLPALEEFVDDGRSGVLLERGDTGGYAAAISRLLRDPRLRASMGSAGRDIVDERFPRDAVARSFERTYGLVLQGHPTKGS